MTRISNIRRIISDYDRLWSASIEDVRVGKIHPDPVPANSSRRWGVSLVFRPRKQALRQLARVAKQIGVYSGKRQLIYGKENVHTTVFQLEFFRSPIQKSDASIAQYEAIVRAVAKRHRPFSHCYKGITLNHSGVMAQGWPSNDEVQNIREEIRQTLHKKAILFGPEAERLRQTSHATLLVFTHPLAHPRALVSFLEQNRDFEFGEAQVTELEIVSYLRTKSGVKLRTLARIPLGTNRRKGRTLQ